jgi:hypothetical protein
LVYPNVSSKHDFKFVLIYEINDCLLGLDEVAAKKSLSKANLLCNMREY